MIHVDERSMISKDWDLWFLKDWDSWKQSDH